MNWQSRGGGGCAIRDRSNASHYHTGTVQQRRERSLTKGTGDFSFKVKANGFFPETDKRCEPPENISSHLARGAWRRYGMAALHS